MSLEDRRLREEVDLPAVNELLRQSLGPYLGSGLYPHFLYYSTDLNPATVREVESLLNGSSEGFDSWIEAVMSGHHEMSTFDHVVMEERTSVDTRPKRHLRLVGI